MERSTIASTASLPPGECVRARWRHLLLQIPTSALYNGECVLDWLAEMRRRAATETNGMEVCVQVGGREWWYWVDTRTGAVT